MELASECAEFWRYYRCSNRYSAVLALVTATSPGGPVGFFPSGTHVRRVSAEGSQLRKHQEHERGKAPGNGPRHSALPSRDVDLHSKNPIPRDGSQGRVLRTNGHGIPGNRFHGSPRNALAPRGKAIGHVDKDTSSGRNCSSPRRTLALCVDPERW